ncbi:MBOAT family O-acyltransferase [Gaetbulibacter aquiaggeris]|uniref:MBOAT family O-acyltransferase n=1 Tax=Gaetbulibacter aquiaggeris TaxID=1735373 RepID=A0ABW7MS81_9FLAO
MIFNSFDFVIFLIIVLILYWFVFKKTALLQNILLLISSFIFYVWADWRFVFLLIASILVNYYLGIKIRNLSHNEKLQKRFLNAGLVFNIGLLLYFKYFNFFYEGFYKVLNVFYSDLSYSTLSILLPLGISFFTFQTIGYIIDVYNEEIDPSEDLLEFSVFIAFFPKLLSGPIERLKGFMPQIQIKREFSYAQSVDGLRQILWGLFAKVVVAENCAAIANPIFNSYEDKSGSVLLIGGFFYAIQVYADFSGYSNMAIGISKLFGINLSRNFATPFYSTNISDMWKKWHISLTSWMMDYVFTPLSFTLRRYQKRGLAISIIATFILVGFWHGANWTYIVFGLLHGLYFVPLVYSGKMNSSYIVANGKFLPSFKEFYKMFLLFMLVMLTDFIFRADNISVAFSYYGKIFSTSLLDYPIGYLSTDVIVAVGLISIFLFVEWIHRMKKHDFEISHYNAYVRWSSYITLFFFIVIFGRSSESFIYFQF